MGRRKSGQGFWALPLPRTVTVALVAGCQRDSHANRSRQSRAQQRKSHVHSVQELRLGASIRLRVPFRSPQSHSIAVSRVLFAVGWLPSDEASAPKRLTADGHELAYLYPDIPSTRPAASASAALLRCLGHCAAPQSATRSR